MGWLKATSGARPRAVLEFSQKHAEDSYSEHVEDISLESEVISKDQVPRYLCVDITVADEDLPFIPASEVQARKTSKTELWIVVDDVVYDCSVFVDEHPGGVQVIESFRGEECSWQFWRFHNKIHMNDFGRPLRVGRTSGIQNRFKERPRYYGLKKLGHAGDDW